MNYASAAQARVADIADELIRIVGRKVQSGPFAGMLLTEEASWGAGEVSPKLLGCYEAELHAAIERAIDRQPEIVVNVGCAEGYYTVGLARRLPKARVYAFDIDPRAQMICKAVADQNGVADRVSIEGECRSDRLGELLGGVERSLLVIDCEGAELKLLDTATVSRLGGCDVLVECHDFVDRAITSTLTERLRTEHRIELIREGPRDPASFPVLRSLGTLDRWLAVCEFRPEVMYWLACWNNREAIQQHLIKQAEVLQASTDESKGTEPEDCFFLVSHHDTVLYVDLASQCLRHRPFGTTPPNLVLGRTGRRGRLLMTADFHNQIRQVVLVNPLGGIRMQAGAVDGDCAIETFDDETISIQLGERFLSADPDGKVRLDRAWCREWEHYRVMRTEALANLD